MGSYSPQGVVGRFGEKLVMDLFDLEKADLGDSGRTLDLAPLDKSFYVEVKTSAYNNGRVIKEKQLYRFAENVDVRRFYAFAYHSVTCNMRETYPTAEELETALDLRSLFIFPFSITRAHFGNSKKTKQERGNYVQLREDQAADIFGEDRETWENLGLDPMDYEPGVLRKNIFLITKEGKLEQEIVDSFHPEFLR